MPPYDPRLQQGAPLPEDVPPDGELPPEELPAQGPPPPDDAIPPAVGDQEEGVTQASPEEQAAFDKFVEKAWELIYSDQVWPQVLEMLEGGGDDTQEGDPVRGLAVATESIVARVAQAADQAGDRLQPDVVFHAAGDILEELAEVSARGKIKDYSKDPDALESAWFQALDMFRERLDGVGEIDQQHAQMDMEKLIQMDDNGTLEKIMRDLAANDKSGPAGGPEPGPNAPQGFKPRGMGVAAEAPVRRPDGVGP
jgi:hypothetical protein